jgi:hypothetical protein
VREAARLQVGAHHRFRHAAPTDTGQQKRPHDAGSSHCLGWRAEEPQIEASCDSDRCETRRAG